MRWAIFVCLLCLGTTAGAASELNWGAWAEEVRKQHPLAGTAYHPASGTPVIFTPGKDSGLDLFQGIALLGEVHDNPAHHQLRAWMIEGTADSWNRVGARPAIVFEQIRASQKAALDRFKVLAEAGTGTADELFRLLEWDKSGWPPARIYKPLFEAAVAAKLPIYAGDPPRDRVRDVARGASLAAEEQARFQLEREMPQSLRDALDNELRDSHCGVLPEAALRGMSMAQRYRDAHLADALLSAERQGQAILIAGNGHIRKDRGVPWHLRLRAPTMRVTTYMFLEVEEGKTDPEPYVPRDPEGKPVADWVIFTPRAERGDPCEAMRKMKR
jgi:uncharacterized iron-regulated protein